MTWLFESSKLLLTCTSVSQAFQVYNSCMCSSDSCGDICSLCLGYRILGLFLLGVFVFILVGLVFELGLDIYHVIE